MEVRLYVTARGNCPALDSLAALSPKRRALVEADLEALAAAIETGRIELAEDTKVAIAASEAAGEPVSAGSVLKEFQAGVEGEVPRSDDDARFNLGIAYREMGLIDEAIHEFQIAGANPNRVRECHAMIGICLRDKGDLDGAVHAFADALKTAAPPLGDAEKAYLYSELATTLELKGEDSKAVKAYEAVLRIRGERDERAERAADRPTPVRCEPVAEHSPMYELQTPGARTWCFLDRTVLWVLGTCTRSRSDGERRRCARRMVEARERVRRGEIP